VSYHFGSLKSLLDAAIENALERYLDAQQARERAAPEATLEELAAAFARPMISASPRAAAIARPFGSWRGPQSIRRKGGIASTPG